MRPLPPCATTAAKSDPSTAVLTLVATAINDMIDVTTTRAVALETHPPPIIFAMLAFLVLASSMLAGHEMGIGGARSWMHTIGFAAILTVALYVILDLEYPRMGMIRIDETDRIMMELRQSMK